MAKGAAFTAEEILLCSYAARFDSADFGGLERIVELENRSLSSIEMKVQNIAAMLDEEGVARESRVTPLTGLRAGQKGRRTNWDVVSTALESSREQHLHTCHSILEGLELLPGEESNKSNTPEGAVKKVLVNKYERSPKARRDCLKHYGSNCVVCDTNFKTVYGEVAEGFIHVHHLIPLSEVGANYVVDPIRDLRPVCPNCHAVIHLGGECRSIEDLVKLIGSHT